MMNEEINSNENSLYELVKEDNSTNMVIQNYNELLSKFENLIKTIIAKIDIGK
ncbi:hypothetical protein N3S94_000902, partial [Campylobacter jejuni]|nr:hypothetical protein [Campylobacter coli]EIM0489015.1 hypothetical protein [Campylobacter coli]EJT7284312.1 hypothetical protein [Campylobacter jejuni]MBX2496629.1 hypothetical protein [Campylobacter coli]